MEKVEVYEIVINDHDESGVDFIALVDEPAIMKNFMAFNKQNRIQFKASDNEKRILMGAVMTPDLRIYRSSPERGDFYVYFTKETIEQIRNKYHRNGFERNVNLMHDPNRVAEDVYVIGSFITSDEMGVKDPEGFDNPEGTWYVQMKVDSEEIWQDFIKSGEFKGFSVEGLFDQVLQEETDESNIIKEIDDLITSEFNKEG